MQRPDSSPAQKILILPNCQLILILLCFVQTYTGTTLINFYTTLTGILDKHAIFKKNGSDVYVNNIFFLLLAFEGFLI